MSVKIDCLLRLELKDALPILKILANPARCQILEAISSGPKSITELAGEVGLDQATVSQHIQAMEKVGLVKISYAAGIRGRNKMVHRAMDNILLHLPVKEEAREEEQVIEMPIGLYTDIHVEPPCGFGTAHEFVYPIDVPSTFLQPKRMDSELIWFKDGYIEYSFPYTIDKDYEPCLVELSAEVCSETFDYNEDFPSDLTVWINGVEIGTIRMPGDMGARYGAFTPAWVPKTHCKYGFLNVWSAKEDGFWVNQYPGAKGTIKDLGLTQKKPIVVKFGFKDGAIHGGLNLFGARFGDFNQAIKMRILARPTMSSNERLISEVKEVLLAN